MVSLLRPGALAVLYQALRSSRRPGGVSPGRTLAALPRLVLATSTGRYRGTSRAQLALMGAAAAYVLSPVDLVPEVLVPIGGLLDDALVLAWLSGAVLRETEVFLAWEASGGGGGAKGGSAAGSSDGSSAGRASAKGDPPDVVPGEVID